MISNEQAKISNEQANQYCKDAVAGDWKAFVLLKTNLTERFPIVWRSCRMSTPDSDIRYREALELAISKLSDFMERNTNWYYVSWMVMHSAIVDTIRKNAASVAAVERLREEVVAEYIDDFEMEDERLWLYSILHESLDAIPVTNRRCLHEIYWLNTSYRNLFPALGIRIRNCYRSERAGILHRESLSLTKQQLQQRGVEEVVL